MPSSNRVFIQENVRKEELPKKIHGGMNIPNLPSFVKRPAMKTQRTPRKKLQENHDQLRIIKLGQPDQKDEILEQPEPDSVASRKSNVQKIVLNPLPNNDLNLQIKKDSTILRPDLLLTLRKDSTINPEAAMATMESSAEQLLKDQNRIILKMASINHSKYQELMQNSGKTTYLRSKYSSRRRSKIQSPEHTKTVNVQKSGEPKVASNPAQLKLYRDMLQINKQSKHLSGILSSKY